VKTTMYAKTVAGNSKKRPTKNVSHPPKPSDAGIANAKKKPRVTQGIRCHHMGIIGSPQNGQLRYGGPILMPGLKSTEQLGHAAQGFFGFSLESGFVMALIGARCSHSGPRYSPCLWFG